MKQVSIVPVNDLSRWTPSELAEVTRIINQVLRSGVYLNGQQVKGLEQRFGQVLNREYVVAVASGTDALVLSLAALGIDSGDLVATVANAAGYATSAILRLGANPLLVDIDQRSGQMSPDSLLKAFQANEHIQAVVVTHLYGLMADIQEIGEICRANGAYLIEDCAQSFGATFHNVPAGSWGDASTFSFYPTKNLAALGDGGIVAFRDPTVGVRGRRLAQYGWSSRYEVAISGGINSRLDEIQAAVVLNRFGTLDSKNYRRRDFLRRYAKSVVSPRQFIFEDSVRCVAHLAVLRTPTRDHDRMKLMEFGIETAIHYPIPDHLQPAWRHHFGNITLPNTEKHCAEVLTLPCFPELTDYEVERVCEALRNL